MIIGIIFFSLVVIVIIVMVLLGEYEMIMVGLIIIGIVFIVCFMVWGLGYFSSYKKINFMNKTYDTKYTTEEYYWNGYEIQRIIRNKK